MLSIPAVVGRVAISTAGRDAGRVFVIVTIEDDAYVYVADGDLRKMDHPKRKKLKHLKLTEKVLEPIAEKLISGSKVFDAQVRSAIRALDQDA